MTRQIVNSQCWECAVMCGSRIELEDERLLRITGNPQHPYSKGAFCVKGSHSPMAGRDHAERVLTPLARAGERGTNRWQRITWSDAIRRIADGFQRVICEHGPLAITGAVSSAYYSRGAALALLLRSLGSPNVMINQDLCQGARAVSEMVTGLSLAQGEDIEQANAILVIGKSPSESDPVRWRSIKKARKRGVPLIVVDPRQTALAKMADMWLPIKPGSDLALALGFLNVLIQNDLYDHEFVQRWCHGFRELETHVAEYTPARVATITGIAPEVIESAALTYGRSTPAVILLGHGVDAQVGGVQTARAFHILLSVAGNVDVPGGHRAAKRLPGFTTYWDLIHDPKLRLPRETELQTLGAGDFPLWAGPDSWAKACHNPTAIQAMLTGKPYPVRAAYVSGVNIAVTYPGSETVRRALKNLDFLVVATHTITPTAALADIVLPKTVTLEEEEVSWQPGGPAINLTQQVMVPRGESMSDVNITALLARELRARGLFTRDFVFWNDHRDFNARLLARSGFGIDDLRDRGFVPVPYSYKDYQSHGFRTPSGRLELYSTTLERYGLSPLPCPDDVRPSKGGLSTGRDLPLVLLTGIRSMAYHHSRFRDHSWARRIEPNPVIYVNLEDAAERGIQHESWVRLQTPVGSCRLQAHVTSDVARGLVATGMGWWWPNETEDSSACLDSNVNNVVSYGPPWDAVLGAPNVRRLPCEVYRAHDMQGDPQCHAVPDVRYAAMASTSGLLITEGSRTSSSSLHWEEPASRTPTNVTASCKEAL